MVGQQYRFGDIVSDEDHGHRLEPVNAQQFFMHEPACLCVEPRERFVHQQNTRLGHETARERDAAAHAAGELIRKRLCEGFKLDQLQRFESAPGALLFCDGARLEGASLVGVVMWGTLSGSMLPFVLRRVGFDPASASAPFVATLVDVSGLVIYFTVASVILRGALL